MPEQLSNSNAGREREGRAVRRSIRAVSLSAATAAVAIVFAAWSAAPPAAAAAFAQKAAKRRTPPASKETARPPGAQADPTPGEQKPATTEQKPAATEQKPRPASEITRARRTAPSVAPSAAPTHASSATPAPATAAASSAAPKVASPAVASPAVTAPSAAPPASSVDAHAAAAKSGDGEAELERLRAEIKDARPGAERARLQRALVERLVALKREPEALDALRLMIHEDRYDPPFFFNTGNALARLGDASAAEDAYRKAISQRRGNYARALNNLGVILTRQGHWDEAHQTLSAALLQENYAYAEASYNLGRLHLLRGEADLAIREWLRTLRLEPTHAEAAVALARAYVEDGDPGRGLLVLDNFSARSARTGASVPREINEARREIADASEDGEAANSKSGDRDARGDAARRGAKFRAHELDRDTYELLRSARAARESGSLEEALKDYYGVLARSPGDYFPPANLELASALINLKRDEEAVAVLLPVVQRDAARYPIAHYHLGRLFERQGNPARAAEHFRRAAELYGDTNPQVLLDLSRVRERVGDYAGALAAMNDYAAVIARQGTVPAWVTERQAKLRQKAAASPAAPASNDATRARP